MISLKEMAASGIKWSSVSQVGRQGVQWMTLIIIARLLSPSDFGLVSMAMVVIGFVNLFKDLGTSAAVIQRKNISEELLSSIFWVNIGFGFLAMMLIFLFAPLAASFFQDPRVSPVLRVLSVTFAISGLSILQQAILQRDLAFATLAKLEFGAVLCGSIFGIGSALLGAGVWSLVYQSLVMAGVTTALLWLSCPWRPRFRFRWAALKSVSRYSLNLTGSSIFSYFARNFDNLLIGRFLGAQNLGYYNLAYRIMLFPLQNISDVVGRVMFPVYSKIQDDLAMFRSVYLKMAGTIAVITFPLMLSLCVLSRPFILAVLGEKWFPVIVLLMILAPVGLVQSIGTTVGMIYQAKGRTDWMLRWGMVSGLLVMFAFAIGLRWGIVGVASAYAVACVVLSYPLFAIPFRLIKLRVLDLGKTLWRPFVASLCMAFVVLALRSSLPSGMTNGWILFISLCVAIIVYLGLTWIINRSLTREFISLLGVKRS